MYQEFRREVPPPPSGVWLRPSDLTTRDQAVWALLMDPDRIKAGDLRDVTPTQGVW